MPAVAPIVINDGAATPVAHTFSSLGQDSKGVWWYEQTTPSAVNPLGAKRIGIKIARNLGARFQLNSRAKAIITLSVPTLEVVGNASTGITPPPTLSYVQMARIEFDLPERGTNQERKDLRTLLRNLVSDVTVANLIDGLLPIY